VEPRRTRTGAVAAVVAATALMAGSLAIGSVAMAAPSDTTLAACAFSGLQKAVKTGGTVSFSVDCTDIQFTSAIALKSGQTVDIEGGGHTVVFDGTNHTRLFSVSGATLTIGDVTLENGRFTGANGGSATTPGGPGTNGGGGSPGTGGSDGTGALGTPGGPGSPATGGGAGSAGQVGAGASGGAR
jgi:hypothetical protein